MPISTNVGHHSPKKCFVNKLVVRFQAVLRYNTDMDEEERYQTRRFYFVDYHQDIPHEKPGGFIPVGKFHFRPRAVVSEIPVKNLYTGNWYWVRLVTTLSLFVLLVVGTFQFISQPTQLTARLVETIIPTTTASPIIIEHPYTNEQYPINFGPQITFTEPIFINEVRDAFIEAEQSFIEVDLVAKLVRIFEKGILHFEFPILSVPGRGSWGEVPAGLYRVETTADRYYSVLGQVYLPHYTGFQGNLAIHGTPYHENVPNTDTISDGVIRLSDSAAISVSNFVRTGMPVLVFSRVANQAKFLYEPTIPNITAPHYFVADIENSTVLASSALDEPVAIASLTKLMTALIAAEKLNLDRSVRVSAPNFVQSLIPRLQYRDTVSMYSLLQLLLVESSNEAAEVIASQIGREEFITLMNNRAASLGMTDTVFADPSGLSADNTSTLRDLFRLTQHIYQTRSFILELSANQDLPTAFIGGQFGALTNFNKINGDDTFIGGKIGETRAAGQTSITLHRLNVRGTERVIAIIILGSESRDTDLHQLLNYLSERYGGQ